MPKYIVHVGPAKTGTTYIQSNLFLTRKSLHQKGVLYPDVWLRPGETTHYSLCEGLRSGKDLKDEFDQVNKENVETVIISCEDLGNPNTAAFAEKLRDYIGGNPVEIVFYVRRWSERIPSIWRQAVMDGKHETFLEFLMRLIQDVKGRAEANFSIMLGKYEQIFGRENLKIVSFNNLVDHGVDLFKHFCEVVAGLPEAPRVEKGRVDRNVGTDMTETEISRVLNYMYYMETARTDPSMRVKFNMLNKQKKLGDLQALKEHMKADIKEVPFKDKALFFRPAFEAINAYRDRFVSPEFGSSAFEPRNKPMQFIGQNYLLRKGAVDEVEKLYRLINSSNLDSLLLQRIAQREASARVA